MSTMQEERDRIREGLVDVEAFQAGGSIKTESLFSLMELPAEIRLKIYESLLLTSEPIVVQSVMDDPASLSTSNFPPVAILHTCRLVNTEATPIFYSNKLTISLPLGIPPQDLINETIPEQTRHIFRLSNFRWSTLAQMKSLSFKSNSNMTLRGSSEETSAAPPPCATFTCCGRDLLARFSPSDVRYSPNKPDDYMALSLSNWVSMKVTRAELTAFQKELEAMADLFE